MNSLSRRWGYRILVQNLLDKLTMEREKDIDRERKRVALPKQTLRHWVITFYLTHTFSTTSSSDKTMLNAFGT